MNAPHPPIPLYLGEVDISVIQVALDKKYADQPILLEKRNVRKEGRGIGDFIKFIYSDPVGASLAAGAMIEIFKATWQGMLNLSSNQQEPSVRVKLKNGDTIVFFESMSEDEILEKLTSLIREEDIEYITFR